MRLRAILLLALAELLGMGLWFGVSSVAPQIAREWHFSSSAASWLTLAVQIGFVAGTLLSALLNLPDYFSSRQFFVVAAIGGAAVNAVLAIGDHSIAAAVTLRFLTGLCLAGVYPPGMKLVATWYREGRGLALGLLIGALTVGKATPYLVNAADAGGWRPKIIFASALALVAAALVSFVGEGPYSLGRSPFDAKQALEVFRNRGVRLASFGYFGHMWELYAMWAWTPVMIRASFAVSGASPRLAEAGSFLIIGAGGLGCILAGAFADRIGRTIVTSVAMAVSGTCCLAIGFLYGGPPWVLLALGTIWGATVVADSAQFSACVTELSDPRYVGTALTIQTSIGFLITTISIEIVGRLAERTGWQSAFAILAIGPVFGVLAMLRLRGLPEALKLAGGRR